MASLWQKFSTLFVSKAHGILDEKIEENAPDVLRQQIRTVEESVGKVDGATAAAKADLAIAKRDITALQAAIGKANRDADTLLTDTDPSNDHFASDLELKVMDYETDLQTKQDALAGMQSAADSLADVSVKLRAKQREMMSQLGRLTTLASSAKAKEQAASAIKEAGVGASVDAVSVDNVTRKIERKAAVADEALKQALGSFQDSPAAAIAKSEADRRIADRRARLAAAKNGGATAAATPATASSTETI